MKKKKKEMRVTGERERERERERGVERQNIISVKANIEKGIKYCYFVLQLSYSM